ncbi:MAG: alanine racemase [Crocinitomicaceae bacterium]|nr:alanine racemase [Crocinitomicaceae bacterium]
MNLDLSINELITVLNTELSSHHLPENFVIQNVVIDTRSPRISASSLFFALSGKKDDGHNYLAEFKRKGGLVAVVEKQDRTLDLLQIEVSNALDALQLLARYHREKFYYPVIGITGSNGKTIVKEWLYHCLKDRFHIVRSPKSYNSQIGVALSILEMTAGHDLAIIEAGISEPGEMIKLQQMILPTIGLFTGLGDAHNSNFQSQEQKKAEKFILFKDAETVYNIEELELIDAHLPYMDKASISNATLVYHLAKHFEMDEDEIRYKLSTLPSISMRLEQLEGTNDCLLLNDAYTLDMAALEIALRQLNSIANGREKALVLSLADDQIKLTEGDAFEDLIQSADLTTVVYIGKDNALGKIKKEVLHFENLQQFLQSPVKFEKTAILFKGSRKNSLEKIVQYYAAKKHITQLEINLAAMRHNLNFFRSKLKEQTKTLVMVKAQSYGTGLVEVAQFLASEGVDYFGVAYADEGVKLRNAGIELPILVMNPEENAFDDIIDHHLEPSIYSIELLQSFIHQLILRQKEGFPIHVKLDTGMNRLGFVQEHMNELTDILQTQPEVHVKSVFSHLAVADDHDENEFTFGQIRLFEILTGKLKDAIGYEFDRHLANSAAALNFAHSQFDMIRIGIGLYGLLGDHQDQLENVLTFTTQISQIKQLKPGDSVGYGRAYMAEKNITIGVIPVGYADGLRRGLSQGNWSVKVNGNSATVIGNICMDMCMIDLTNIPAKVGDKVQIFGDDNTIFEMAKHLYTIPYEIISGISSRVHRVYLD